MTFQNNTLPLRSTGLNTDDTAATWSWRPEAPVIDCQWHWYPAGACEALLSRRAHPLWRRHGDGYLFEPAPGEVWHFGPDYFDLDRQFEHMDEAGIDAVVVSPVIAGDVAALQLNDAREVCLLFNEELARAQRQHPARIHGLAVVPVQDTAAAIDVLEDAVARLGMSGLLLHSNVNQGSIADQRMWPLYERVDDLGLPVFLHPTHTSPPQRVSDYALEQPLSYMFDTTVAAVSLIVGGVLDRFPHIRFVHPHLGATLPYLVDRIDVYRRLGRWDMERPARDYLGQFHTDTVSESPGGLRMAIETYGINRLLFSSDYPYFPPADGVRFVADNLAPADAVQVFSGNASRLLGLTVPTPPA